jgi:hypothetical protein
MRTSLALLVAAACGLSGNPISLAEGPVLQCTTEEDSLVLRWSGDRFDVQQCDQLGSGWSAAPGTASQAGDLWEWRCNLPEAMRFYRLKSGGMSFEPPDRMGIILDATGQPLPGAEVADALWSDAEGVWSGTPAFTAAGWYRTGAFGFAATWSRSVDLLEGAVFSETRLTPFSTMIRLSGEDSERLHTGPAHAPSVEVIVQGSDLESRPAYVGLAEPDLLDVDAGLVPLEGADDPALLRVIALQAVDEAGAPVGLAPGKELVLTLPDDDPDAAVPVLARFDPEAGTWVRLEEAVTRADGGDLEYRISELAPLHGIFSVGSTQGTSGGARSHSQVRPLGGDYSEQAFKAARARLVARLAEIAEMLANGEDVDVSNDAEVRSALEEMADLARDYATGNVSESGKVKLMTVAEAAMLLGQDALANDLMQEATEVAEDLARKLLGEGDCGRVREMLHAMQQLMLMGGDEGLIQQLQEKLERLFKECDLWTGSITYLFFISQQHPGVDELVLTGGGGTWSERHEVRIATHAKTHVVTGEDRVTLQFPEAKYTDPDAECEMSIAFYGQPAGHSLWLNFGGTYDGLEFNLTDPGPANGSKPVDITQRQVFKYKDDDLGCLNVPGFPQEFPFPNYYSALMHGFLMSPPITLQEMMETGSHSGQGEGETIRGSEGVENAFPEPNYGKYPFTSGHVVWNFIRVQAILPLEE